VRDHGNSNRNFNGNTRGNADFTDDADHADQHRAIPLAAVAELP
jgi:hypothetical protein